MDCSYQLLAHLLSAELRRHHCQMPLNNDLDLDTVISLAKAHDVYALLYRVFNEWPAIQYPHCNLAAECQKASVLSGIVQIQHIEQIKTVLNNFNLAKIPVIALKGLVLRYFYPHPELRNMVDADILIHKEDLIRAKNILLQMGYLIKTSDAKNILFTHKYHLAIELHFSLAFQENFNNIKNFEINVWKNAKLFSLNEIRVLQLSTEDLILHILLHMAEHLLSYGFGLRQVCDLVLLTEAKRDDIDWDTVVKKAEDLKIEDFMSSVFSVCKKLFDLDVPSVLYHKELDDDPHIDLLIKDIFSGGVFGGSTPTRHIGNQLLHYVSKGADKHPSGRIRPFIAYIFPPTQKLGTRYLYAKNNPILYPFAWIHRFLFNIFRGDLINVFKATIVSSNASISVFNERSKLLKWLGLR